MNKKRIIYNYTYTYNYNSNDFEYNYRHIFEFHLTDYNKENSLYAFLRATNNEEIWYNSKNVIIPNFSIMTPEEIFQNSLVLSTDIDLDLIIATQKVFKTLGTKIEYTSEGYNYETLIY